MYCIKLYHKTVKLSSTAAVPKEWDVKFNKNILTLCKKCGKIALIYGPKGALSLENQKTYKILLNGRNGAFVNDFIQYTESYFKCLSTSDCPQDVMNHFEIFQPDAYVCFAETENSKVLFQTNDLRESPFWNDAPIIVI